MYALRAVAILFLLAIMAVLLAKAGQTPVDVTLHWGTLTVTTIAPVAATLIIMVLLGTFYLGQLGSWLGRLPRTFSDLMHFRRRQSTLESIVQANAAIEEGNIAAARKLALAIKEQPGTPYHNLTTLLLLRLQLLGPQHAEAELANPLTGAAVGLYLARQAASYGKWEEVRRITAHMLKAYPNNAGFQVLHFKALVNLNDAAAASAQLAKLKTKLGSTRHKLLATLLQGPNALNARPTLDNPWVKSFHQWLATPSDVFPPEEPRRSTRKTADDEAA